MSIKSKTTVDANVRRARLCILGAAVLWSLAGVFIKALALNPLTIVFYRSLFAALFFAPLVQGRSGRLSAPLWASALSYTAAVSAFVAANKLTSAANAIVLQYTAPIFVFIFARLLFREKISRPNLVALAVCTLGVGIIYAGSASPDLQGVGVALFSGLCFAIYMTNLRFLKNTDARWLTFANNLACSLVLLPWVAGALSITAYDAAILVVMGVVQLGIPYFLFSKGLEKISLQEASLIVLVEPVLNPVWVAASYGEVPGAATLAGGALILTSLAARYGIAAKERFRRDPSLRSG
ncbi:MAG TPA: EamA family transporter [Verrucomicrobiae bacterium]|jgi:drug/metabolite transporter (DMT)-like permease|nr:EamA family transporter [Verrucomicrobiae bacterium]